MSDHTTDNITYCRSFIVTDQVKNTIKVSMGTKKKGAEAGEDDGERDEDSCHNKKFTCPKFKATVRWVVVL